MVIITNSLFFLMGLYGFIKLSPFKNTYAKQMRFFIFMLVSSSMFGAILHGVQYQLGMVFFNIVFFVMGGLILLSAYYCFRGAYTLEYKNSAPPHNTLKLVWITALIFFTVSVYLKNFLVLEGLGGIALVYSFIIHLKDFKEYRKKGSQLVILGIGIAFSSIVIHLLKLSVSQWFNYKDISHVVMICSLVVIYLGVISNSQRLSSVYH